MAMRSLAWVFIALSSTVAAAQESVYSTLTALSGKALRVGYYASSTVGCTAGPLPEVKVIEPPTSGTMIVRRATLTTNRVNGCPNIKLPSQVIFYVSHGGFHGKEHVVYDVITTDGRSRRFDITIDVKAAEHPPAQGQGQKI